ncbi:hypothetical protein QCA50_014571 [Cerrena zonata]|uniref:Protein kinase domain-containing protein n=1 Tax=Cerrena zonata TaxID=2478898 RepID=A0AAW0FYC9_9APHY
MSFSAHQDPPYSPLGRPSSSLSTREPDHPHPYPPQSSPTPSDDSVEEPSMFFDWTGDRPAPRHSNLSGKSSPPTSSSEQASPVYNFDSPIASASRRSSLSRSESAPSVSDPVYAGRSFQRVASGPLSINPSGSSTPGVSLARIPVSTGLSGTGRKIGGARRVIRDEAGEEAKQRKRPLETQEKENVEAFPIVATSSLGSSRPFAEVVPASQRNVSVQGRQMLPVPARRLVMKHEPISETEDEYEVPRQRSSTSASVHPVRPRRSASLSEAGTAMDDVYLSELNQIPRPTSRGARRVTIEEKLRQERQIGYAQREAEEAAEAAAAAEYQHIPSDQRHTPSPTHVSQQSRLRPIYTHQRKDSDTLRSMVASASSPTVVNGSRNSPPQRQYAPSSAHPASVSNRHRRSPTVPEAALNGKQWAVDGRESENFSDDSPNGPISAPSKSNGHAMPPPPVPLQQTKSVPNMGGGQSQMAAPSVGSRTLVVNKRIYARLDMIGKGGSSRVYRAMNASNEVFAIKRVSLDKTDAETMSGYMNEISLLKRLEGNSRIIRLVDSEVKAGPGGSKGALMLVMECGEIDLARLLQEQQKEPMDLVWVSYYWKQMLQAVHVIHEEKIVHSDLKPANFVLVKGQLKLIDFGIANAIANDTTNIQRDHQIGTVNYMSPEAIELPDGMRRLKVGRQSDVWSLGCILYQMVYGCTPFHHLSVYQKMKAIPDSEFEIDYPDHSVPTVPALKNGTPASPTRLEHLKTPVPSYVVDAIKSCLTRNPKERATIPELLSMNWLTLREQPGQPAPPPPPAPAAPVVKPDEAIINPHFMAQLLEYGMNVGLSGTHLTGEDLKREAARLVRELRGVSDAEAEKRGA